MGDRPANVKYSKTHEWVRIEGDEATVGITDFAVEHLGDLVFVQLPTVGETYDAKQTAAEVESVKAVAEVYSPVPGKVVAVNDPLTDDQSALAADPFGAGWLWKLKVTGDLPADLMDLPAYEAHAATDDPTT